MVFMGSRRLLALAGLAVWRIVAVAGVGFILISISIDIDFIFCKCLMF